MKYPKINTLWKRDEKNKNNILIGNYSKEEFKSIKYWSVTEKIDGTNVRIEVQLRGDENLSPSGKYVEYKGKTDDAQIPTFLLEFLQKTFTEKKMRKQFNESSKIFLFGEGYGPKIQKVGKKYRKNVSFILFDAWVDGWWLEPHKVNQLAKELGIDYVPILSVTTTEEVIKLVKNGFQSKIAKEELLAESIVARSHPLMLFRDGSPIMWKLKYKDYQRLK